MNTEQYSKKIIKDKNNIFFILGPCVIESRDHVLFMAEQLKNISEEIGFPFIFKSSFDKANRTSINSYRGPGIEEGLKILEEVKQNFELPLLTDIHQPAQAVQAADVVNVLQIPAFLCRQTDLVIAAGETGRIINVKKGQFLSPYDVEHIAKKITSTGNKKIIFTERGHKFGYNNLITDIRAIPIMQNMEGQYPVVFDATHSAQMPGGSKTTGGCREFVPHLARAAAAAGCDGVFMEIHDNPKEALSDSATQYPLLQVKSLLQKVVEIGNLVRRNN
ncbi:MAG: 3-deoxy-8-phosphooctulonate synthase [Candidatus Marinimicrobia bacterium]|nr:3-deoxy-8-phosphooctulonate synthase [Candidatus Neomarinimicrobiota bacterium]